MASVLDVFCENYTYIDYEVLEYWIAGASASEAAARYRDNPRNKLLPDEYLDSVPTDIIVSDFNDHYRLYGRLEQTLLTVGNLKEQMLFQMNDSTQCYFIQKYYSLDSVLCR